MGFNRSIFTSKYTLFFSGGLSLVLYAIWAYDLARFEHFKLFSLYSILFVFYYLILNQVQLKEQQLTYLSLILRLVFIGAIPNLSQDFYRFIWDGLLLQNELNPYAFSPDELIKSDALFDSPLKSNLYEGMGALSAQHYSNYPPVLKREHILYKVFLFLF